MYRAACLLAALAGSASPAPRPARPWAFLESSHATIGKIAIEIEDVFDLAKPSENTWLGRTSNHLHASTREMVIRRVLLFKEGDRVRTRRIYETERLLRALPFVKDAHIEPRLETGGVVVAHVRVRDAWTTQVNAGYASVGGQKSMNFGIDEKNFLGTGKGVAFDLAKDHERSTWGLTYADPQLFGSRWTLALQTRYLSDGNIRNLELERPFFALDTPWSTRLTLARKRTSLYLYDAGAQVFQAPFVQDRAQWAGARALYEAGDRVWRGGLLLDREDTQYGALTPSVPPGILRAPTLTDRRLRGAALTLSTQKDAFESFQDLQGTDTPEDYNLAWNGSLALGRYGRNLGSTVNAPFFQLQGTYGRSSSAEELSLLTVAWSARKPPTGLEDSQLGLAFTQYRKLSKSQILAGIVTVDLGRRLDPEHWYYLGGDQGMRGYPNQMHPGDGRCVVSLDYRYLTGQRWWGVLRLGYCAFVDAGTIRLLDGQGWSRVYTDVGIGLRLGNLKSSLGRVVLLSVAVPLVREPYQARYQFMVGNTVRF